jgi:acyl carrier protein
MNKHALMEELVAWINRKLVPAGAVVDADTQLFRAGFIDSIRILELIAWTERATNRVIPDRMIRMDHFQTARTIADTFAP